MATPPVQQGKRLTTNKSSHTNTIDHPTFLRDSLEVLFTVECLVVTAYLEAVIPLFYTAYILVMVHLPSSRYHTEMVGMTPDNVVARILPVFTFGLLEIAPLVLLVVVIKRNCRMRAIYHLAFVLESQRSLIQIKLIVWVMITLCFRVMHFGTLYSTRIRNTLGYSSYVLSVNVNSLLCFYGCAGVDFTFKFKGFGYNFSSD